MADRRVTEATDVTENLDETANVDETANPGETELVGPGRYPLRIQPAAALMPGTADAKRLLIAWYIRKSFYWMAFVGIIVAALVEYSRHPNSEIDLAVPSNVDEPSIMATWGLFLLAIVVKFVNGWVALALAVPLALAHEPNLAPRTNVGSGIGRFFDRKHLATAFRSLRWTHHVRQVALGRLGTTGDKVGKLDTILDIVNVASGVLAFVVITVLSAITAT